MVTKIPAKLTATTERRLEVAVLLLTRYKAIRGRESGTKIRDSCRAFCFGGKRGEGESSSEERAKTDAWRSARQLKAKPKFGMR